MAKTNWDITSGYSYKLTTGVFVDFRFQGSCFNSSRSKVKGQSQSSMNNAG